MLDPRLTSIARALIEARISDPRQFGLQVQAALNRLGIKGLGHSSAVVTTLTDFCVGEVKERLEVVWIELKRVIVDSRTPLSDPLADELISEFDKYLPLALNDTREVMATHIRNAGMGHLLPDFDALTQPRTMKKQ
jgi:hypothetical protein